MSTGGWIGVDLDGTLAQYGTWQGAGHIGEPVPLMLARVQKWLTEGREVRIFTARIYPFNGLLMPEIAMAVPPGDRGKEAFEAACAIAEWCRKHIGRVLPITNVKDYGMIELWDDRCVQVEMNTGRTLSIWPVQSS